MCVGVGEKSGRDLSVCAFAWSVGGGGLPSRQYLAVFDLNRWYHAHMLSSIRYLLLLFTVYHTISVLHTIMYIACVYDRCDSAGDMCSYLALYTLDEALIVEEKAELRVSCTVMLLMLYLLM